MVRGYHNQRRIVRNRFEGINGNHLGQSGITTVLSDQVTGCKKMLRYHNNHSIDRIRHCGNPIFKRNCVTCIKQKFMSSYSSYHFIDGIRHFKL